MFPADPAASVPRDRDRDLLIQGLLCRPITLPLAGPICRLRHPLCLAFGFGHALTVALVWRGLVAPLPLRELAGLFLLTLALAAMTTVGLLVLRARLWGKASVVTLHLTPPAVLTVGLSLCFGGLYTRSNGTDLPSDLGLLALVLWLVTEAWLALFATFALTRASTAMAPLPAAATPAPSDRFALAEIVMMRSDGKHVVLTTTKGRARVAGPLSALIDTLPKDSGSMIHRSLWVAAHAVLGHHRQGRRLMIDLSGGHRVEVALSRQSTVLAWLRGLATQGFASWPGQGRAALSPRKDRLAPRPWARPSQDAATP